MKMSILLGALLMLGVGCSEPEKKVSGAGVATTKDTGCGDGCCKAKNNDTTKLMCGLSSPEMRKRKETVLASLKKQVQEKKELPDGYAFKFSGSDAMVDELTEFIKTERECCGFFTFNLSVAGDKNEAWLQLTGPDGAKDFITSELGL